jgi:hypothetical protein
MTKDIHLVDHEGKHVHTMKHHDVVPGLLSGVLGMGINKKHQHMVHGFKLGDGPVHAINYEHPPTKKHISDYMKHHIHHGTGSLIAEAIQQQHKGKGKTVEEIEEEYNKPTLEGVVPIEKVVHSASIAGPACVTAAGKKKKHYLLGSGLKEMTPAEYAMRPGHTSSLVASYPHVQYFPASLI